MRRKKDITSYFCTKKTNNNEADIETEPDDGVERAEEKQVESATRREPDDLGDTGFQGEGTEQERQTDEDPESEEAEREIQAERETQTLRARSERHKQAMVTWRDYQRAAAANATLVNVLNQDHSRQVKENREYIKAIGEMLLLTATQNMAQRGHDESADS